MHSPDSGAQATEPALLRAYSRLVALLCRLGLALAAVLIIVDTLLIGAAVLLRYVFSHALPGSEEIVAGTLTALVLMGAPEVLRRGEHIGVDILTNALPPRAARWAGLWSSFSVLLVAAMLMHNGWKAAALSRMIGLLTQGNLELPVWMLQLFLPLGGFLLGMVSLELIWRGLIRAPMPVVKAEPGTGGGTP